MLLSNAFPTGDSVRSLDLSDFDLRFDRYRINQPKADLLMARSLTKYSQLAPVIYCQLEVDEQVAIFNLNRITSKPNELEESWIIYALVHDDGLPQIEVA